LKKISIISDLADQFSAWGSHIVLEAIRSNFPELLILSILIKPLAEINGLKCYQSLLSVHSSLNFADCVLIRGYDDAINTCNVESASSNDLQYSLEEVNTVIACDIIFATFPNDGIINNKKQQQNAEDTIGLLHNNWPFNTCTHTDKIIDVRSSLYRILVKKQKKKSKNTLDYNAIRAMCANIHSLHVSYSTLYPSFFEENIDLADSSNNTRVKVTSANYVDILINEKLIFINNNSVETAEQVNKDLLVSFKWATPNFRWTRNIVQKSLFCKEIENNSLFNGNDKLIENSISKNLVHKHLSINSTIKNPRRDLSTASSVASNKTFVSTTTSTTIATKSIFDENINSNNKPTLNNLININNEIKVSAVVFDACYGKMDLKFICNQCRILMTTGAYSHL
jgi:hypothetical protein